MGDVQIIRLLTVHPGLVHLPIGAAALLALAYVVAAVRRSERWTFAGDVATVFGAATAIVAAAFGLVSWLRLPWPGGLGTWRWLHLGLGVATTLGFVALAAARVVARRRRQPSGRTAAVAGLALGAVVLATGWVGGEVLVFEAGIAVEAAGLGALAPIAEGEGEPRDIHEAMGRMRAAWATAEVRLSTMVVERPSAQGYEEVAEAARQLAELARWVAEHGEGEGHQHGGGQGAQGGPGHAEGAGGSGGPELAFMAGLLEERARELAQAASARMLPDAARAAGDVRATCAACHQSFRWR